MQKLKAPAQLVVETRVEFKDEIMATAGEDPVVAVDFSDTAYIDSSGMGMLVGAAKDLEESGGALLLHGLSDTLLTLFDLTKLSEYFYIKRPSPVRDEPDEEEWEADGIARHLRLE